jgi:hypothetical protein
MSILKKIFYFSLFIFILTGLLWGAYNLSFKKPQPEKEEKIVTQVETEEVVSLQIKKEDEERIVKISDEIVISPTLSSNEDEVQFFSGSGEIVSLDFFGKNRRLISTSEKMNVEKAMWSFDKTKIILKVKNNNGLVNFFLKDLTNNSVESIRENVDEISWQAGANRIFYKYYDEKTSSRSLNVSDPNASNWQKIADVSYRDISIAQIPKSGLVSFWNQPDAYSPTIFTSVPIIGGEVKTIFKDVFGADYLWDHNGNRILLSQSDAKGGSKMQLGMINYNGGEYRNLSIPTFVSKCVWSKDGKTIYYALPGGMPENAVLPNEYDEKKFTTADTFWKLDTETNERVRLVETSEINEIYDADNLFLDKNENFLFFVNRIDKKLRKISL